LQSLFPIAPHLPALTHNAVLPPEPWAEHFSAESSAINPEKHSKEPRSELPVALSSAVLTAIPVTKAITGATDIRCFLKTGRSISERPVFFG
jgi:hypothetical protein